MAPGSSFEGPELVLALEGPQTIVAEGPVGTEDIFLVPQLVYIRRGQAGTVHTSKIHPVRPNITILDFHSGCQILRFTKDELLLPRGSSRDRGNFKFAPDISYNFFPLSFEFRLGGIRSMRLMHCTKVFHG